MAPVPFLPVPFLPVTFFPKFLLGIHLLIDKLLSKKETLMFQDVLLFKRFQQTYCIQSSFIFIEINSEISPPKLTDLEKSALPSHSTWRAMCFSLDLSVTNLNTKQAQPYDNNTLNTVHLYITHLQYFVFFQSNQFTWWQWLTLLGAKAIHSVYDLTVQQILQCLVE